MCMSDAEVDMDEAARMEEELMREAELEQCQLAADWVSEQSQRFSVDMPVNETRMAGKVVDMVQSQ